MNDLSSCLIRSTSLIFIVLSCESLTKYLQFSFSFQNGVNNKTVTIFYSFFFFQYLISFFFSSLYYKWSVRENSWMNNQKWNDLGWLTDYHKKSKKNLLNTRHQSDECSNDLNHRRYSQRWSFHFSFSLLSNYRFIYIYIIYQHIYYYFFFVLCCIWFRKRRELLGIPLCIPCLLL